MADRCAWGILNGKLKARLAIVRVRVSDGHRSGSGTRVSNICEANPKLTSHRTTRSGAHRWRSEYGGLKGDQVKRLKELETENKQLRRAVSDLTLQKLILKEAALGTGNPRPPPSLCVPCYF